MNGLLLGPKLVYKLLFNKPLGTLQKDTNRMACIEPVIEDAYVTETTANPEIYRKCKRQNIIIESVELKDAKEKIDQEQKIEMKRITQERAALTKELRKLIIDGAVVQRSDVTLDFPALRQRRKSREFEDITLPSKMSASSNLTAFVNFGRFKSPVVSNRVIKRAMSDQKLNTLRDLRIYQHWEGDPAAINSVRREQRPRAVQMEHTNFCRSRRFDNRNQPIKSMTPAVLSRQSSASQLVRSNSAGFRPLSAEFVSNTINDKPPIPSIGCKEPSKLAGTSSRPSSRMTKPKKGQNKTADDQSTSGNTPSNGNHEETSFTKENDQNSQKEDQRPFVKGPKHAGPAMQTNKVASASSQKNNKTTKQPAKRKSSLGKNKVQPQ